LALGLKEFCDYILSRSQEQYYVVAPVAIIVEAKNENIIAGLGQCIAAIVAAQLFNERAGSEIAKLYGAVTTGTNWKFMTLSHHQVNIDAIHNQPIPQRHRSQNL
jgi:hypothetical protein